MTHELARRCEEAGGPDRELDALIWWAVDNARAQHVYWNAASGLPRKIEGPMPSGLGAVAVQCYAPAYTKSIDAAMTLVPEGAGLHINRYWIGSRSGPAWLCEISCGGIPTDPRRVYAAEDAYSAALALCAAALRSRPTQGSEEGRR